MTNLEKKYVDYVLTHDKRPTSVYAFMKEIEMEEKEFYSHHTSFAHLEEQLWATIFQQTADDIQNEGVYATYSAREKTLALYYAFFETAKSMRSFLVLSYKTPIEKPTFFNLGENVLGKLKTAFEAYIRPLLTDGVYNGEIADRTFLTERYAALLWYQTEFLIRFWIKDTSKDFEKTDLAVEKSVNLVFDTLGKNILDGTFDFVKFLFSRS